MSARPLFSLPDEERLEIVRRLVGRIVEVDVDVSRDGDVRTIIARAESAAKMLSGTTSSVVVLYRGGGRTDIAVSLAQVRDIRPLRPADET